MVTVMFGGAARPLGINVQFLEVSEPQLVEALPGDEIELVSNRVAESFPRALEALLPFQMPWTRRVTASVGRWTALANNAIGGSDGTAPGPRMARDLGVRCVVASHAPRYGPGHAQTQLEVMGPGGEPPLMGIRSLSCTATDGRWEWHEWGQPLSFEETGRYGLRRKRDRFDRPMLLRYLEVLGISVEDDAYGQASVHQQLVTWPSREVTLDEARADFS